MHATRTTRVDQKATGDVIPVVFLTPLAAALDNAVSR